MTQPQPAPPDWLLVGTPKSATTLLTEWLRDHPEVFVSKVKELNFFTGHWDRGWDWYLQQFSGRAAGQRAGEASIQYCYSDDAMDRIAERLSDARLLLMLREPVARLWSQYWWMRSLGIDPRRFSTAVQAEVRNPNRLSFVHPIGYLEGSRYAPIVRRLFDRFERDQVLVIFYDDLRTGPVEVWTDVCNHIGVTPTPSSISTHETVNPGQAPRSAWLQWGLRQAGLRHWIPQRLFARAVRANLGPRYPKLPDDTRRRLSPLFADDLRQLEELLGRRVPPGWTDNA